MMQHKIHLIKKLCFNFGYKIEDYRSEDVDNQWCEQIAVPKTLYVHHNFIGFVFIYSSFQKGFVIKYEDFSNFKNWFFKLNQFLIKNI